jgi:hypothetical protein
VCVLRGFWSLADWLAGPVGRMGGCCCDMRHDGAAGGCTLGLFVLVCSPHPPHITHHTRHPQPSPAGQGVWRRGLTRWPGRAVSMPITAPEAQKLRQKVGHASHVAAAVPRRPTCPLDSTVLPCGPAALHTSPIHPHITAAHRPSVMPGCWEALDDLSMAWRPWWSWSRST